MLIAAAGVAAFAIVCPVVRFRLDRPASIRHTAGMTEPRRLLRLLRSKQGGDDLLRQLMKAQAATDGAAVCDLGDGFALRVRALGKASGPAENAR